MLSMTAGTFRGRGSWERKVRWAPSASASARPSSVRLVAQTSKPAARPSWMRAVAIPPVAPWISTVSPARSPDLVKSARYAVSQAVPRTEAWRGERSLGRGLAVPPRHDGVVGESAVDEFAGDVPPGIELLVISPVIAAHYRVAGQGFVSGRISAGRGLVPFSSGLRVRMLTEEN